MSTFKQIETTENAIEGISVDGRGIIGRSTTNYGVRASSVESAGIRGSSEKGRGVEGWASESEGVVGISEKGNGVWGQTPGSGTGTLGTSKGGAGVAGRSEEGPGVRGDSRDGRGIEGASTNDYGVRGHSQKSAGIRGSSGEGRGVEGWATHHEGVVGLSESSTGVWGQTKSGSGVLGTSKSGAGVVAISEDGEGIHAQTTSRGVAAIAAYNTNPNGTGAAVYAQKDGPVGHAGFFNGNVHVTGLFTVDRDICCTNADCAEEFDIVSPELVDPGTVVVVGNEGSLHRSERAYDKRVAGVISGAGSYRPAIVLDRRSATVGRKPVALLGKVYCKVDASYGPIEVGDLLTTSGTPGHAMKAAEPLRAFGAVIGKALRPLEQGVGLIPILIALQ